MTKSIRTIREIVLGLIIPFLYFGYVLLIIKTKSQNFQNTLYLHEIVLLIILLLACALWFLSYFYLHPSIYLFPQADKLVYSGPYKIFRHPVYLSSLMVFFSLSLLVHSWPAFWYTAIIITPVNFIRAYWEEKVLMDIFGNKYKKYQEKTFF